MWNLCHPFFFFYGLKLIYNDSKTIIFTKILWLFGSCYVCFYSNNNNNKNSYTYTPTHLQNKRFALKFKFRRNASKFPIFIQKENPSSFFRFSFRATLSFLLMNVLVYDLRLVRARILHFKIQNFVQIEKQYWGTKLECWFFTTDYQNSHNHG